MKRKQHFFIRWLRLHEQELVRFVGEDREQVVEKLGDIASTANILPSHEEGNFCGVIETIGGPLRTPHMNCNRIHAYFGRSR